MGLSFWQPMRTEKVFKSIYHKTIGSIKWHRVADGFEWCQQEQQQASDTGLLGGRWKVKVEVVMLIDS